MMSGLQSNQDDEVQDLGHKGFHAVSPPRLAPKSGNVKRGSIGSDSDPVKAGRPGALPGLPRITGS